MSVKKRCVNRQALNTRVAWKLLSLKQKYKRKLNSVSFMWDGSLNGKTVGTDITHNIGVRILAVPPDKF